MRHAEMALQENASGRKVLQERCALVTLTIGLAYGRLARITYPFFHEYADRHGLAFVPISHPVIPGAPHFQKLACFEILEDYERIMFVDTDVLISPDAPNLFEIVPLYQFGAYDVSQHTAFHDHAIALIQERLKDIGWRNEYFNSGVMVASRMHREVFNPSDPDLAVWTRVCEALPESKTFSDQTYLNYKVQEYRLPFFDIGYRFNHSLAPRRSAERFSSYFIHCKGHRRGTKEKEVARAAYILRRPRLRAVFSRYPGLARIYDGLF